MDRPEWLHDNPDHGSKVFNFEQILVFLEPDWKFPFRPAWLSRSVQF
jgi:hypothetical protein